MINAELIKKIFEKSTVFPGKTISVSPEIDDFLRSLSFKHYNKQQIEKIYNELSKKHIYEVLQEHNFPFSYNSHLLDNICSLKNLRHDQIDYLSSIILFSYIAFVAQFEHESLLPEVQPLFKSFINISFQSQSLLDLSGKCFNYIFQLVIRHDKTHDIYTYIDYYLSYAKLFRCPKLTIQLFDRLFVLEQKFYDFLNQLSDIFILHPNFLGESNEDNYTLDSKISSQTFFLHIIEQLIPTITQFEPSAVKLFQSTAYLMTDDAAMTLFTLFSQSLHCDILEESPIHIEAPKENENELLFLKIPKSVQLYLNFPQKPTFDCEFDPSQTVTFPHQIELKKFIDSDLIEKLKDIEIMTKYDSRLIEFFLSSLFALLHFQEKSNFFYNIIASILYFSNELFENLPATFSISTELALSFFHPRIFDSSFTVFDNDPDFTIVNTFRSIAIEWLCLDNGDALNQLMNIYFISYPLLLAELLYRFVGMTSVIIQKVSTFPKLIESFRKIAVVYQEFDRNCDRQDEKKHDSILKVRVSLYTLFAHLFTNDSVLKKFFLYSPDHFYLSCENSFTSAYLSFLFEERIRPYVITYIRNFFVNNKEIESNDIDAIASIFNVIMANATAMLPGEEAMLMIKDFFGMLNEIMLYNQISFAEHFKDLCPVLCSSLPKLTNCDLAKQVFDVSITFFTLMSSSFEIKNLEIDAILSCLVLFNDTEFVDSLYKKFIQLLAGERLLSIEPSFIVKQPQIIKIFIQILFATPRIKEVLVFFYDLLQFSPINLQRCANCDLDIYILEFLEKEKVTEKLETEVIQKVLSTYSLLSSRHSTTQSVLRFISLLAPIDESRVSKYESLFFTAFENIISTVYKIPEYVYPLNNNEPLVLDVVSSNDQQSDSNFYWNLNSKDVHSETVKIVSLIDLNKMTNGFSLAFWIRVEPSDSTLRIFSIFFGKNVLLSLSISNNSIFFSQDDSITESVLKVTDSFPFHTWQFVVLSYVFQSQRSRVFFDVNCVEEATSTLPALKTSPDFSCVKIIVNDNHEKIHKNEHSTQLGLFAFFPPLTGENQLMIREMGVRSQSQPSIPFYFFIMKEKNYVKNDENNLIDILITKCGIDTILPIFKLRDYRYKNGGYFDFQIEYGLILLNKILLFNEDAQKKFYYCQGFNILCQLIIDYWLDKFNMKLYTNLISILQSLTNERLQVQLFNGILTYFPFLMQLKPHLHEKILRYVAQSVFISFKSIAMKCRGFGVILSALRKFYYYSPTELTIIYQPKNRPSDLNIQLCRSFLFEILFSFASDNFSISDFECIVSHCISCTELAQILDMFAFIVKVFGDLSDSIDFAVENDTFSFLIFFFIRYPNEKFQFLIVDLIDNCHRNRLISDDCFISHVTEIIKMLPKNMITKEMVKYVRGKFNENPLFLPLMCFLVIQFKDDELLPFINSLVPSVEYVTHDFWAIWPLCLTLYCSAEDSLKVILFVIQCDPSKILDIYSQFDTVFELHLKQRNVIENAFLAVLSHVYIVANKPPPISDFLELSERIIFFGHKSDKTAFNLLCSQLDSTDEDEEKNDENFSPQKIFDAVTNSSSFNDSLTFKVSYSSFQCWSHVNLALTCTNKFLEESKLNTIAYGFFDLVLCSFLQEYGLDNVCNELLINEVQWNEVQNAELAIQLLHYHSIMAENDVNKRLNTVNHSKLNNNSNLNESHSITSLLTSSPYFQSFSTVFNSVTSPLLNSQKFEIFKNELLPKKYINFFNEKLEALKKFHTEILRLDQIIPKSDINKYVAIAMDHILLFDEQETQKEEEMKKKWKRLWSALTVERAPWCMSCSLKNVWKRDTFLCTSLMTPLMMIRMQQVDLIESNNFREKESKFSLEVECIQILPSERKTAIFSLSEKSAYITVNEVRSTLFYFENIKFIFWQKNCGILFITSQGISRLIEFFNEDDRRAVVRFFESHKNIIFDVLQNIPSKDFFYTTSYQKKWLKWKITNYQYLVFLNFLSGRNFFNVDSYPVMPWVLADYESEKLEIDTETEIIRNMEQASSSGKPPMTRDYALMLLRLIEPFKSLYKKSKSSTLASGNTSSESVANSTANTNESTENGSKGSIAASENTNREGITGSSENISKNSITSANESSGADYNENGIKSSTAASENTNSEGITGSRGNVGVASANESASIRSSVEANNENDRNSVASEVKDNSSDVLCEFDSFGELFRHSMPASLELVPEYFSMPEVVEDDRLSLPKWSSSPIDFVYKHRKVLESDAVSQVLHEWISTMWSKSRHSTFPLFDGLHPMRNLQVRNSLLDDVYDFEMTGVSRLACSSFSDKTGNKTMTLFAFNSNGVVFSYKFSSSKRRKTFSMETVTSSSSLSISSASSKTKLSRTSLTANSSSNSTIAPSKDVKNSEEKKKRKVTFSKRNQPPIFSAPSAPSMNAIGSTFSSSSSNVILNDDDRLLSSPTLLNANEYVHQKTELILIKVNKYDFPFIQFDKVHSLPNGKFLIFERKFNRVAIVGKKHFFLETQLNQITCLASDGVWIVIGGDSSVNLFKNGKFFCSIQLYRDLILTVAVSSTFNAVVGGTKDGSLIICSSLYGSMVKVIEMKKMVPVKIIISPSWGFIVSYYQSIVLGAIKHYLFVHTINGKFVRKIDINFAVEDWICWSNRGFDYILILANDGEIFYAEVYFLSLKKIFKSAKMQAVSLAYSEVTNCAIVTQSSGHAYFIPLVMKL